MLDHCRLRSALVHQGDCNICKLREAQTSEVVLNTLINTPHLSKDTGPILSPF
jgi:hypothetical protein